MKQKLPTHFGDERTMKTNADPSHPGLKNTCAHDRAFTLTDLLVVMATLAILAAVMLPAPARSGDDGARTVCLNNLRQMGMALNIYVSENQDYLPWVNWGNDYTALPRWMVRIMRQDLTILTTFTLATWAGYRELAHWPGGHLKTGVYWQYLQNPDVFMCPVDVAVNVGTPTLGPTIQ